MSIELHATERRAALVLSKAVVRCADMLGLHRAELAQILGLSESAIDQLSEGAYTLELGSQPAERAALVVRLFLSISAWVGDNKENLRKWMSSFNTALGARPCDFIKTFDGLTHAISYLDGSQGII